MEKTIASITKPKDEELKERLSAAREKLATLQIKVKEAKIPVLVVLEGFGAAGKGSVLSKIIKNMDPRFFHVETMEQPEPTELRKPFLYRYFKRIPENGQFTFMDGGWMEEIVKDRVHEQLDDETFEKRIRSVKRFERTLSDNGYTILKFFFYIDEKEQKKRMEELLADENTAWRVSEEDLWQNKKHKKCAEAYQEYMEQTNQSYAPWYAVDAQSKKWAELQILERINQNIETALANNGRAVPILPNLFPLAPIPKLADVDLNKSLTEEEYQEKLSKLQKRLSELHNVIYRKKIPVIIAYEGWDAAGKGGNIKRIASALDARGYEVYPIASPEPHEKNRHFLWRFWTRLPKSGHIAIFDRTWYGRVMVERLEGFCFENDWQRAYNEINEFEKELNDWGAVIVKFWVQIDKDTQLERFTLRQNTPEKQWKITEEDWRNREKWDAYEEAVNEMLRKTNTTYAPWKILESNDKKYARIKALETVIHAIEEKIKNK
ncbi:polyphosphate:AMP phosphotransferase [Eubacterium sp. MSJ-33]|uniref:polyphosphate:AMP phosphotransferase n=1 Tax=Eubacterium sp. MSJ-33 TaxID=2841528 RepID=UPI001C74ADFB|nr:polyphosphate:AMP phosphotransferase [Eubacterium sp. MSJ-33]QWT53840.1 polyphosphate:AMP phosphotransferase [Eubacterium sp. MSJ-33]